MDCFRTLTFKEAKEWIEKVEEESKKRYEMYMKCQFPYHLFFDHSGNASYTLYCQQLWSNNINNSVYLFVMIDGQIVTIILMIVLSIPLLIL